MDIRYFIKVGDKTLDTADSFGGAVILGERHLNELGPDVTTVNLYDNQGLFWVSLTHKRIIGVFKKMRQKKGEVFDVEDISFDATDEVFKLPYRDFLRLKEGTTVSERIGRSLVKWRGLCEVEIADSVCSYFGVDDIKMVSPHAFGFAGSRVALLQSS